MFLQKARKYLSEIYKIMKTKSRSTSICLLLLTIFTVIYCVSAQSQREVLTNAKIIELVRLGLSEALIIEKIRQSECKCDTSTTGLARLKAAKVSDAILLAMMESTRSYSDSDTKTVQNGQVTPTRSTETDDSASPKELRQITEPGIYLFEDGKMTAIEAAVFSGSSFNPLKSALTFGIKKLKFKAKVRGKSANMQTGSQQPVFYFVFNPELKNSGATMAGLWGLATSPNEFLMVQMSVQTNSREAVMGEMSGLTGSTNMGSRDKDVREYSFEKIKTGVYKVVPKTNLAPGEYAFYYAGNITGLGYGGGKVYDFGVKAETATVK